MTHIASRYESDLKPLKMRFFIAAALLLIVAIASVRQLRSRILLEQLSADLIRAQSGLARVKEANANRRRALTALQSQLSQFAQNSSPEMVLYRKIDEIKARLSPDNMTIGAVEKKGGEASLPYSLVFNNPDFNNLLNAVSYLHGAVFPLSPVSSVAIMRSDPSGTGEGSFTISGKVITSEKTKP